MAHGVLAGLGEGRDEREFAGARAHVADDDHADGHAVAALDAHDCLGDGGVEGVGGLCVSRVEPGTQLALLGEGDGAHAGGILGGCANEGEGLEHGVVQVGGDVGTLGFAHALRLGLRQVLRRAQPHGDESEEHARDQCGPDEAAAQQDDGRVIARGHHDDAEAEQHDTAENRPNEAQGPPGTHVAALAPHEGDTGNDRNDRPHVSPVQGARRVQDRADDRSDDQGHAGDEQAVARHLRRTLLAQSYEAGAERVRAASLRGILGDRHPQPQIDAEAETHKGHADHDDAHEHDRHSQVHGQSGAHASHPRGRHVRARGGRAHERGPGGRRRNGWSPPRVGGVHGSAHAPIVACHGGDPRGTPTTIRGRSGGPLLSGYPVSLVE